MAWPRWKDSLEKAVTEMAAELARLKIKVDKLMATQAELQASLDAIGTQLQKASDEITAEIANLQAAVAAAGSTTPEIDASVARLQTLAASLDALNPDAP